MAYDANAVVKFRTIKTFVVKETTAGTLEFPAAADAIYISGESLNFINQRPEYTDSPEISNTRDVLDRVANAYPPGSYAFQTLVRPSGTAGTEPLEDTLLECLCGTRTHNAGTSYVYTPMLSGKPTMSLWFETDAGVFALRRGTVNQAQLQITNQGYLAWNWSGQGSAMLWAGHAELNGGNSQDETEIDVVAGHEKHFSIGMYIQNITDSDTNTGAGYKITEIDTSAHTITITPGIVPVGGWSDEAEIAGYLPTPSVPTSYSLAAKDTTLELDDVATSKIQGINVNFNDPLEFLTNEINSSGYPETTAEGDRRIDGSLKLTFTTSRLALFTDGYSTSSTNKIEIINAPAAGKSLNITLPYAKLEVPQINPDRPVLSLDVGLLARASSGEDSFSITYY